MKIWRVLKSVGGRVVGLITFAASVLAILSFLSDSREPQRVEVGPPLPEPRKNVTPVRFSITEAGRTYPDAARFLGAQQGISIRRVGSVYDGFILFKPTCTTDELEQSVRVGFHNTFVHGPSSLISSKPGASYQTVIGRGFNARVSDLIEKLSHEIPGCVTGVSVLASYKIVYVDESSTEHVLFRDGHLKNGWFNYASESQWGDKLKQFKTFRCWADITDKALRECANAIKIQQAVNPGPVVDQKRNAT